MIAHSNQPCSFSTNSGFGLGDNVENDITNFAMQAGKKTIHNKDLFVVFIFRVASSR